MSPYALLAYAATVTLGSVQEGTPPPLPPLHGGPAPITCPVGGEKFEAWRATHYSTYGERPDGMPYSYLPFPFPVPECPSNKLIVFSEFSGPEVAILSRLIETPEYRAMIANDTSYYRGYWLASKLGRPEAEQLNLLLQAIWQVSPSTLGGPDPKDIRMQRYQAEFVKRADKLSPGLEAKERLWIRARAANAARQLGHFEQAESLRRTATETLVGVGDKSGWDSYLSDLRTVIARRDTNVEPLDMIPVSEVASVCARGPIRSSFERAKCAEPEVIKAIEESRATEPRPDDLMPPAET